MNDVCAVFWCKGRKLPEMLAVPLTSGRSPCFLSQGIRRTWQTGSRTSGTLGLLLYLSAFPQTPAFGLIPQIGGFQLFIRERGTGWLSGALPGRHSDGTPCGCQGCQGSSVPCLLMSFIDLMPLSSSTCTGPIYSSITGILQWIQKPIPPEILLCTLGFVVRSSFPGEVKA